MRRGARSRSPRATRSPWTRGEGVRLLAVCVLGLLLALAFPPFGAWPLAFVAVAGLSLATRGMSARRGAQLGAAFALVFFLVLLRWLRVIGWDAMIMLSALQAAFYAPLGAYLAATATRRAWPLWHVSGWLLVEALRARYPLGGLPWGKLAFAAVDGPLAAFAAWGGSPAVSAATAGVGIGAAAFFLAARARPTRRHAALTVPAGSVLALLGLGVLIPLPTAGQDTLVTAVVQGNVPRLGFDIAGQRDAVLTNHLNATAALAADIRAGRVRAPARVIWPENASDDDPFTDPVLGQRISAVVDDLGAPLLVGTLLDAGENRLTNTGIVFSPEHGAGARYSKRHLVPFGEYIPGRAVLTKFIGRLALIPRDFLPGTEPGVLAVAGTRIGAVICFEVAYDDLVRDTVRGGGRLLVVQTNNATYGRTGQPEQQLAISRLRSIEHGRAMLIAATSGVSAVIAPDGEVIERTAEFTADVLVAEVPLRSARTLATRLGAWPEWLGALPAAILVGAALLRRTSRRIRSNAVTVTS
ncbi:MAG: apolipoprotein N-acyltransferase [Sporichthyaceae bacterium]